MHQTYSITAEVWLYDGPGPWHFITLPVKTAEEIKKLFADVKRGWGSLPVTVTLGKTTWQTSIFPDKKLGSYVLPLKAEVRKKEKVKAGDEIKFSLEVRD